MIRIAITRPPMTAICATLPFGSTGYENKTDKRGEKLIWLIGRWWTGCALCGAPARAVIIRLAEAAA